MEQRYSAGGQTAAVRVEPAGVGYRVTVGGETFVITDVVWRQGELSFSVAGQRCTAFVAADGPRRWVALAGEVFTLEAGAEARPRRRAGAAGPRHETLTAQMPGVVRQVLAAAGERVERGQALVVLEAMKMEIRLTAPQAGQVVSVKVSAGETVQRGQLLVDLIELGSEGE